MSRWLNTTARLRETDKPLEDTTIYLPAKSREPYVRIDWTKPVEENWQRQTELYVLYRQRLEQAIIGKLTKDAKGSGKAGGALTFMNMSKDQLKANYSIQYIGEENLSNGTETVHLQLTPKADTSYKMAEIWVDKDGMPMQTKVIETNSDCDDGFTFQYAKKCYNRCRRF